MAELTEIPLELQLKEADHQIKLHQSKGRKFQQFLSPMFFQRFPAVMDNQISVDWDTITGVYNRMPFLPITLIDTEILDEWFSRPTVWEVAPGLQHSRCVLAMVHYTLPSGYKGQPAIVFGASFVFIPTHQAWTNLCDTLSYLKHAMKDCVILVSMPMKPMYSPQPRRGKYLTLLPISSDPDIDRGPLHMFAAAVLPVASREGRGGEMPVRIKLPPCFRSSKWPKMELIWEPVFSRGLLWKNTHFVERNTNGKIITGQTGKPLCQELTISLAGPGGKLDYTPTERGRALPLTLAACHPGWDDYLDLNETITQMANCLMAEDGQEVRTPPKMGTTHKQKEVA